MLKGDLIAQCFNVVRVGGLFFTPDFCTVWTFLGGEEEGGKLVPSVSFLRPGSPDKAEEVGLEAGPSAQHTTITSRSCRHQKVEKKRAKKMLEKKILGTELY